MQLGLNKHLQPHEIKSYKHKIKNQTHRSRQIQSCNHSRLPSLSTALQRARSPKQYQRNWKTAAIRLLVSEDSLILPTASGLSKLQEKHPPFTLASALSPSPPDAHLLVTDSDVHKAVVSFPVGSAGGPDGLKLKHLKEMLNCAKPVLICCRH